MAMTPRRHMVATVLVSVVAYGAIAGANFDPKVQAKFAEAFGSHPFGVPAVIVVTLLETLLYIPAPWFFWHALRVMAQYQADGGSARGLGYLPVLWTMGKKYPELRRSGLIALAGVGYLVALITAWIVYASIRGI